ncbi:MAG: low-specificity L-threonine aldolase [Anaerolineales bacterium]|nr:low-specificity L-threonine aldolase [Anaerolineales bacterium]
MNNIDMRSDTVTWPTPEMRHAMAAAEVGDDVYGEDPTVNRLQEAAAQRLGKEAALFVPSGAMGNLIALMTHCQRGDEAILGDLSHPYIYETGGMSALGGIQPRTLRNQPDGTLDLEDIRLAVREDDVHFPISRLIALENTHNRCNGVPLKAEYIAAVGELARQHGLLLHIDGARIFNATAALGVPASELVAPADSVTFCLSKGLCAPVGSVLCGSADFIRRARRIRKQLGGGMRQAGVLAAAGLIALDVMTERLGEDHARAARLAAGLAEISQLIVHPQHTNIIRFELAPDAKVDGQDMLAALAAEGIRIGYGGYWGFRIVTHYWIDDAAVDKTLAALGRIFAK